MPMTRDEQRERLAVLCGWLHVFDGWVQDSTGGVCYGHPFPDGDLTALARAWPEGWCLRIEYVKAVPWGKIEAVWGWDGLARKGHHFANDGYHDPSEVQSAVYPTEYDARLALTIAVMEAALASHGGEGK